MVPAAVASPERGNDQRLASIAQAIAAGLAMGVTAWLSIELTRGAGRVAAIWPANAIILACLLAFPVRRWPWFLAGGLACNFLADLLVRDAPAVALGLSACNTLEIVLCAGGLRLTVGPRLDLSRLSHLAAFGSIAFAASLASALAGAAMLEFSERQFFWRSLLTWVMADGLGLVVVTPVLLALDGPAFASFVAPRAVLRNLSVLTAHIGVTAFVFLEPQLQVRYLAFASLIFVAFQTELVGAALAVLATGALAVAIAVLGGGPAPIPAGGGAAGALLLQLFLLTCVAVSLPVGAAVARRRELAAALASTARDFQALANHSSDFIIRIGLDGRIAYASPSCRRLGYEPEDLIDRSIGDFTHPDDLEQGRADMLRLLAGDRELERSSFERRILTASGAWVWTEGNPQIVWGASGQPESIVTHLRDITQRKTAQAALAESEARYRMLADRVTDIIVRMNADGTIAYVSPSCRRIGWEPAEMEGRSGLDFIHENDRSITAERLAWLAAGTDIDQFEGREFRALRRDGGHIWVEANTSVLRGEDRTIVGAVAVLRDVTERKAIEAELKRKRAEAEAAAIAKSEFLANMSHEIRTPLTGIVGFAALLEAADNLPASAATYARRIATASRALLTVVNDILDFSKIESGQVELDPRPFDPAAFVAEAVELVSAQAAEKNLSLGWRSDGRLPPVVTADATRLRQVVLNLLGNAVKFTDQGGVMVTVGYSAGQLAISVADTGVGIAPEHSNRLFQRFTQADGSISRQYGGTGLGLAICKSLTTLMGGEIGVESATGEGARFWFTVAAPAAAGEPIDERPAEPPIEAEPAKILVVDDAAVNRELVRVLLSVFGHQLIEAAGGAEAVKIAAETPFDLILMDLQMPGVDGLAAAREIRATSAVNRETPIVALSANILPEHLAQAQAAGMNDHIAKPIDTRELLTKVARWADASAPADPADGARRRA